MRKRIVKKSEVVREGYIQGLKDAKRIISMQLNEDAHDVLDNEFNKCQRSIENLTREIATEFERATSKHEQQKDSAASYHLGHAAIHCKNLMEALTHLQEMLDNQ